MPSQLDMMQVIDTREDANAEQSSTLAWATTGFLRMQGIPRGRTTGWRDADVLFIGSPLTAEFEAWDAASDEALANFEANLG